MTLSSQSERELRDVSKRMIQGQIQDVIIASIFDTWGMLIASHEAIAAAYRLMKDLAVPRTV